MKHDQYASLVSEKGEEVFINAEYITTFGYNTRTDKTFVSLLDGQEYTFPGNQVYKIRNAIDYMD